MSKHAISGTVLCLAATFILSPAHALTKQELVAKLQAAGYSQVGEGKSTAEGTVVKAVKDGKEVTLVVDSSGQIQDAASRRAVCSGHSGRASKTLN